MVQFPHLEWPISRPTVGGWETFIQPTNWPRGIGVRSVFAVWQKNKSFGKRFLRPFGTPWNRCSQLGFIGKYNCEHLFHGVTRTNFTSKHSFCQIWPNCEHAANTYSTGPDQEEATNGANPATPSSFNHCQQNVGNSPSPGHVNSLGRTLVLSSPR